jgi:membrane protease subunit HflK
MLEDAGALALEEALRTSFQIVKFLMGVLVIIFLFSGVFTVKPNELAVRLHFGRPVGTGSEQLLKPGLHWAFPYPIDEIVRIPVGQSRTLVSKTGWYAVTPEQELSGQPPTPMPFLQAGIDGYTLTGDGNTIHAKATLKYRLDPARAISYTFNYTEATNLIQNLLDNSLIHASAQFTAERALYLDLNKFREQVTERFTRHLEDLQLGIVVEGIEVQTTAPISVKPAFDDVIIAVQAATTNISQAEIYARISTNAAAAEATRMINDGLTHSNELVKTVASDASMFSQLEPHFRSNPQLFKQRLLTETMERVLTNAQEKFFIPARTDGKTRELRLQLSREPLRVQPSE